MINYQKGATLYFAIIIMSILLAAVFSISSIVLVQIKTIKGAGDSVVAFYAADTGIEAALDDLYGGGVAAGGHYVGSLGAGDYGYETWVTQPPGGSLKDTNGTFLPEDAGCEGLYYCIKSIGTYHNVKRAIEVKG